MSSIIKRIVKNMKEMPSDWGSAPERAYYKTKGLVADIRKKRQIGIRDWKAGKKDYYDAWWSKNKK